MNKVRAATTCAVAIVVATCVAKAQTSSSTGAHAFDWMLGTWTCKNSVPGTLAGPAIQTLTATRSDTADTIVWRYTGKNYDQYGFLSYDSKTGMWWLSWSYPGGSVGNEATKESGKVTHWTGQIYDASTSKHEHLHDTYTMYGSTKFNDTSWDDSSGSMKIGYNGTCTKQ